MALNLKSFLDKINDAINAGGKRLEQEAEQFGYSYAKNYADPAEEEKQAPTDKE